MTRPVDVVDAQADLLARMANPDFQASLAGVMASQAGGEVPGRVLDPNQMPRITPATSRTSREAIIEMMEGVRMGASGVQIAYPFHVSEDMTTLVAWAATQLDEEDTFNRRNAPTGAGIARFDGGLRMHDIHGKSQVIHWLIWQPGQASDGRSGTAVWMFNDWEDPDDTSAEIIPLLNDRQKQMFGRWAFIGLSIYFDDDNLGPAEKLVDEEMRLEYEAAGQVLADDATSTNAARLLHAFWLMLDQTVTMVGKERLPGINAKRARRAGLEPEVTVVKLRRAVYPERPGEAREVAWTKRWIVRGHWRWQPCGPGRSERRRIWVNPFVKGPEDAPLAADTRVYGLHR